MANEVLSKEMLLKVYDTTAGSSTTPYWKTIARATGYSLEANKETVEVTSFDSNSWKEFLVDLKEWSMSADGIVVRTADSSYENYEELLIRLAGSDATLVVQLANPAMYTDATDGATYSHQVGAVHLTSINATGSLGDKQTYSASFQGTGELYHCVGKYDTEAEAEAVAGSLNEDDVVFVEDNVSASITGYYQRTAVAPGSFATSYTAITFLTV